MRSNDDWLRIHEARNSDPRKIGRLIGDLFHHYFE
jgi:hypothetical protein